MQEKTAFLTVAEVAETLRVWPDTVRIWIQHGRLPAVKLPGGRGYRIRREDLDLILTPIVEEDH